MIRSSLTPGQIRRGTDDHRGAKTDAPQAGVVAILSGVDTIASPPRA